MAAAENLPRLISEADAAEYLGVSRITMRRLRAARKIAHIMVGVAARYTERQLLDYLDQQTCPPDSDSAPTGSKSGKDRRSGTARGGTAQDASSALRSAQEILNRQR